MRSIAVTLLLASVVALTTVSASADTIRVAKDGTGDFTLVADGVLAAASGDTVTIGPGEYPEIRTYDTPGGLFEYVAVVEVSDLTIIGDDRDSVIIGPQFPAADLESGPIGIATATTGNLLLKGVTVRNLSAGIEGNGEWIAVEDSRFLGHYFGVDSIVSGYTTVRDCEFVDNARLGIVVFEVRGSTGALVEGCSFRDNRTALDFQPANCELRDSSFAGGVVGAQVSFGGSALIQRCTYTDISGVSLTINGGSEGRVFDCTFAEGGNLNIDVSGLLIGSGNELGGGVVAAIRTNYYSEVALNNSHILNYTGGYSVLASDGGLPEVQHQDFTGNYWGTSDTAQINDWIHDVNDDEEFNSISIDYLPIADQPIPTESTSFGELKARYGGEK